MPIQTGPPGGLSQPPWEEMADAYEALRDAERAGNAAGAAAARVWVENCRERCGLVGALLLSMALEHGGLAVQKKLAAVFDGLARAAWERATTAKKRATWAVDEIQMLKERIAALERQVQDAPPNPARLRAG